MKANLAERGVPCWNCPFITGKASHTARLTARMGERIECPGGGTCFGALAHTQAYYNVRGLEMSNKSQTKKRKREERMRSPEYKTNIAAEGYRGARGEAPPHYPSSGEMLKTLAEAHGLKPSDGMVGAVNRANSRLEPKRLPRQPGATDYSALPVRAQRVNAAAARVAEHRPSLEIPEAALLLAMEEARAAGRGAMTPEELTRLLALPYTPSYAAKQRAAVQ